MNSVSCRCISAVNLQVSWMFHQQVFEIEDNLTYTFAAHFSYSLLLRRAFIHEVSPHPSLSMSALLSVSCLSLQ